MESRTIPGTDAPQAPRLASIILNWNNYDVAHRFLESFSVAPFPDHEIIVVDNESPTRPTEKLQAEFPNFTYIYNSENVGIAAGNNLGMKYALAKGAEYIFLFNFDLQIIDSDFFTKMVAHMDVHPEVGMLAPGLLYPDRRPQNSVKPIPTIWNQFYFDWFFVKKILRRLGYRRVAPGRVTRDVEFVMASALLVRRKMVEDIGLEDERFFLAFEDMDWCVRAREKGWRVRYFPEVEIIHLHGAASKALMTNFDYYFGEKLRFFTKHYSSVHTLFFRILVSLGAAARAIFGWELYLMGKRERKEYARGYQRLAYRIWTYPWSRKAYEIPARPRKTT